MPHPLMSVVDAQDEAAIRAAWDVVERAQRADRPYALLDSADAVVASVMRPSARYGQELLVASLDGEPVGVSLLGRHLQDNAHLADLEVNVLPEHRRRGIGRSLLQESLHRLESTGHVTALCEVVCPPLAETSAALEFARAGGFETVHTEEHLVLELPASPGPPPDHPGYEVVTWTGACPEEHLDGYCRMRTQMNTDVPLGEVDMSAVEHTPAMQRDSEQRLLEHHQIVVAGVRRRDDGEFGGYSLVFLPHGSEVVWQDDTLVMPEHRGNRLGLAMKHATLEVVGRQHPERTVIHTWTDPDNAAMHATNLAFGFEAVERMHEVQRRGRAAAGR